MASKLKNGKLEPCEEKILSQRKGGDTNVWSAIHLIEKSELCLKNRF